MCIEFTTGYYPNSSLLKFVYAIIAGVSDQIIGKFAMDCAVSQQSLCGQCLVIRSRCVHAQRNTCQCSHAKTHASASHYLVEYFRSVAENILKVAFLHHLMLALELQQERFVKGRLSRLLMHLDQCAITERLKQIKIRVALDCRRRVLNLLSIPT